MGDAAGNVQSSEQTSRQFLWIKFHKFSKFHKFHSLLHILLSQPFIADIQAAEVVDILPDGEFVKHSHILHYDADLPLQFVTVRAHLLPEDLYHTLVKRQ